MARFSPRRSRKPQLREPGSLVYHGGDVHEVLADGVTTRVREDLTPGSPKSRWKPKFTMSTKRSRRGRAGKPRAPRRRIPFSRLKKGQLHRDMRVPAGQKIPLAALRKYAAACRREIQLAGSARSRDLWQTKLRRAQLAINMRGFKRKRGRK